MHGYLASSIPFSRAEANNASGQRRNARRTNYKWPFEAALNFVLAFRFFGRPRGRTVIVVFLDLKIFNFVCIRKSLFSWYFSSRDSSTLCCLRIMKTLRTPTKYSWWYLSWNLVKVDTFVLILTKEFRKFFNHTKNLSLLIRSYLSVMYLLAMQYNLKLWVEKYFRS